MRRLIEQNLREWKDSRRRKPLIVRGARQVGKTYSVEQFGRESFQNLAVLDLERNREVHRVFYGDLDPHRILSELELLLSTKLEPGKTLLFLDEIQSCPRAIMALRYLYEERPDLHVIAAGSLLEFAMTEISFPVGRVQFLEMHPMSFAEYLTACGREDAANMVASTPQKVAESAHRLLLDELKNYFFVGGMPESVKAYVETRSMQEAFATQRDLIDSFRHDFAKYSPKVNSRCLEAVLAGVARSVGTQVIYTHLAEGFTQPTIKRAFDTLCMGRIITRVPSASPAGLPLGATASSRKLKAILVDIGLWQSICGVNVEAEYHKSDLLSIYRGAMAEQFVGQEMMLSQNSNLYYWARQARGSIAEVDYLAVVDGSIVPIEVKSGAAGCLRSLHLLLQTYPRIPFGVVLSSRPYSELQDQRLKFIPMYYACSLTGGTM